MWLNRPIFFTGVFIVLSSIILTVTILNYNKRKKEIINNINTELRVIAELKASEISTWINERVTDSKVLTEGYFLSNRLDNYIRYGKRDDYLNIYEKATAVKKYYNYEDVFILDSNNNIILSTNQSNEEFSSETRKVIDELKQGEINFKVYQCNYCKKVHLDFLNPIYNSNTKLIGYALLRSNPNDYLFPLISRWPTQSNTAETIIVRREGDSVLFINNVRHRNNAALKIKVPLTRTDVVAAKVVLGATGLIEGHDYRDLDVLAYALPIENSNWAMIAKIDQEEVYRPVKRLYITYGTILSLLFLFLATVVFLIRNTYQKSYIKKLYDKELERKALVSHYKYLIKNANDIILLANSNGEILEANDAALKAYQIPMDKVRDTHLNNLGFFKLFTDNKSNGVYETIHSRLDGTKFPVEINEQYITIDGEIFYQAIIRDITEQKLVFEKLNASEELHRLLFDCNPLPMWVYDTQTLKFLKVNDTACQKYGYTRDEFLNMTIRNIRPNDEIVRLEWDVETSKDIPIQHSTGWNHKLKSGEIINVDIHSHSFNYDGKKARMVAINDITDKQKAKDELEKSQQFLSSIIENSGSLIYVKDIYGKYLMVNKRWTEYTGYQSSDVVGKMPSELFRPHNAVVYIENDRRVLSSGQIQEVNEELETELGTKYFISIQFPLRDSAGNITGLCGMSTDVTKHKLAENEIKKSEEKYRSLIESSDAAITMMDFNGEYIYLNEIATRPFGKSPEKMIGVSVYEIFPAEQVEQIMQDVESIKTLNQGYVKEVFVDLAGKPSWFRTSMQPVRDESGKPYAVLTYSTNITESKLAEEKIRESEEKLNYAQEIANIGSWDFNLRTRTGSWSKNLYKLLEVDSTLPPLTIYDFYNMIHPEDKERYAQMISLTENGENFDPISIRIVLPSGKMRWIQINAVPKFKDGELIELSGVNIDITKSKEFEEKITTQNEKLKAFINAVPDKIFVHDEYGNFLEAYTSKEAFIAPIDQILGKNLKDLFGEDIGNFNIEKIKECISKQELVTHEFTANVNGAPIYFEVRVVPFMDNMVIRFVRDITERKIIEEEIIKSEERFRSTLDSMIEGCQIIDHNWNYVYINFAAEKQNRRPINELIGKNYVQMWPGVEHTRVYKQMKRCMIEKVSYSFDNEFTFPNGETAWFRIGIQPIPEGIFILSVDITEKKQADLLIAKVKERLDLATESADIAIWDWDIVRNELVWDDRMYKLYGLKADFKFNAYEAWLNGIHPDDQFRCDEETQQALNNEKKYDTEFRVIWSDGTIHWLKANGQVFRDRNGKPVRMVGVNYDISKLKESENEIRNLNTNLEIKIKERTAQLVEINAALVAEIEERKSIEEALKDAREEANNANIAKSEFLSRMSHELRTPLNSILGFAQLLEMGELNPNQKKGVTHIMKSGKHLLDLINEVLDISRIEAGRLSLSPEPVQIQGVISETIDIVRPLANEKNINVELNNSPICDLYIKADRQRVKQILINLINNGIKYNNNGGYVKVECNQLLDESKSNQFVRISIIDNGYGISEENLVHLFTPFERAGAEKTTIEGTGLGLAVAKKLVEAMGGTFGVESKLDKGSTFWIQFPQCESQLDAVIKHEGLYSEDSSSSIKKGTILYVEDNIPNIELIEQVLDAKFKSIKLITTRFGKETLGLAIEHKPNLILLDLNLPDTHGAKVFEELKSNMQTMEIPVVVISADAMPNQLNRLLNAGVKQYLTKPLDISEFLKVINKYVEF